MWKSTRLALGGISVPSEELSALCSIAAQAVQSSTWKLGPGCKALSAETALTKGSHVLSETFSEAEQEFRALLIRRMHGRRGQSVVNYISNFLKLTTI